MGAIRIEHRPEGRPVVGGLPQPTGGEADEVDLRVVRVHGDVVDAAALADRPDGPPAKVLQQRMVGGVDHLSIAGLLWGDGSGYQRRGGDH